MRRNSTVLLAGASAMVLSLVAAPAAAKGGGAAPPADAPDWFVDEAQVAGVVEAVEAATGVEALSGEIAGAAWVGQVPDDWNGDLVIYAHGYRGEGPALTVDPAPEFAHLVENGYAWAASSYRANSYDPGVGVLDTKNLTQHMRRLLRSEGRVQHTYLVGVSMGGHVTGAAIERYSRLYDGALPVCGVMGDFELFDYFLDYNVAAVAFAGIEPGYDYPTDDWIDGVVAEAKAGLSLFDEAGLPDSTWAFDGSPLVGPTTDLLFGPGQDFKDFVEVGSGGERATFDVAWDYWHAAGGGNFFFDLGQGDGTIANRPGIVSQNTDTSYAEEYGFDIDDRVQRVKATASRNVGNPASPVIKGTPKMPVLTMHTTGDLFVPIEMQQIYAQEVAANGLSDNLVQRAIRDVGHCTFTSAEWQEAYADLFGWVRDGVRPEGEDLVAGISDPQLGCDWTTGAGGSGVRGLLEPCD